MDGKRVKELYSFLDELAKLTKKYKFEIGGCGCCGSPFVRDLKYKDNYVYVASDLKYYRSKYTIKES
jgi:hypothetical protein